MRQTRKALKKYQDRKKHVKKKVILEPIPKNILEFVGKYRIIKGQPYSLKGREFFIDLYLESAQQINIVKARQMGATEFAMNWLFFHLLTYPGTCGLYVTDREDHVSVFADRVREAILSSEKLKPWVKKVTDESVKFVNGSVLYMITGWGKFEKTRSYPVDFAVVDEVQSLDLEGLPVLKETMSASLHKRLVLIGTGSDQGDLWWDEWHRGAQLQWKVPRANEPRSQIHAAGIG